ncbi:hypothetical protein I6F53_05450 [Pseudoalteromonas sp. SWN29]|uniref:hypothetical protein n=1 Tax=Pseudoalteromonas sp. SWN29 TaxID=2792064 RepID=UPI0018CF8F9D|nr:hypothetical protein [Pseudoalteromonas sp. SWN29]MBH0026424.1 hypothetical protein [Pseudoalteromonas sp. SWN29]
MGLKGDYEELISSYRNVSLPSRLFLIVFFFISISSIASLADTIFKWKGFIADLLLFYQNFVVTPIITITSKIGFNYSDNEIHACILLTITINIGMRLLEKGQIVAFDQINKKYSSNLKPDLKLFKILAIIIPIASWFWYGLTNQDINLFYVWFITLGYPIFLVGPKWLLSKFDKEEGSFLEKEHFNYFSMYYLYLLSILLVVGVLGAINSGLHKVA